MQIWFRFLGSAVVHYRQHCWTPLSLASLISFLVTSLPHTHNLIHVFMSFNGLTLFHTLFLSVRSCV